MKKTSKLAAKRSFTGKSQHGDLAEALRDALEQAQNASGVADALIKWKLKDISGQRGGFAGVNELSVAIATEA